MVEEKLNIFTLDAKLLLEKLIMILPFPAYIKSGDGKYLLCNDIFADKLFGVTPDEIVGKTVYDFKQLISKEEADYCEKVDRKLINEGGEDQMETGLLCADGFMHIFHEIKTPFIIDAENTGIIGVMIDLTETVKIKKAYSEQENFLKIFMDYIPDAVFFKDKNAKYLKANNTEAVKLGVSSVKDVIGKDIREFYQEENAKQIFDEEKEVINSGRILNKEENIILPDGKLHWLHTTKVPFPDETGEIVGLFGISRDITENKSNEENLTYKLMFEKALSKISNNLMKLGYGNFEEGVIYAGKNINELFDSEACHFFFNEGDNLEYSFSVKTAGDNFKVDENIADKLLNELSGKSEKIKYIIVNDKFLISVKKIGSEKVFNIYLPLMQGEKTLGAIVIEDFKHNLDLVERNSDLLNILAEILGNAYELSLMESERIAIEKEMHKMIRAVEQSANIVMILNIKGKVEYVNQKFNKLTGYSTDEIMNKNPLSFVIDKDDNTKIDELWKTIKNGHEWNGTFLIKSKNGDKMWFSTVLSPIYDNGNISNIIAILEDVTEKINSQNQMAVSQKLEAIGQLAAGIAHEINTPMQFISDNNTFLNDSFNSIVDYLKNVEKIVAYEDKIVDQIELLKKKIDFNFLIEEIPQAIEQSKEGIQRVSKIVRAMKEFAHPGVKDKSFHDINNAIKNTVAISRNEWKYCADMELKLENSIPEVYCLIDSINQVILNMIVNAVHAIEKKIGKSAEERGKITIATEKNDNNILIKIKDTGNGIPNDIIDRIFDPFFTTKEVGKGTGQGLAIAHDIIVNKHKGSIKVNSVLNEWTEFIISLPIKEGELL